MIISGELFKLINEKKLNEKETTDLATLLLCDHLEIVKDLPKFEKEKCKEYLDEKIKEIRKVNEKQNNHH